MPMFDCKVAITHSGTETTYVNIASSVVTNDRENNYKTATITFPDSDFYYLNSCVSKFDEVKVYFKNKQQTTYAQVFGGYARQPNHTLKNLTLICKGYGAALEDTHCNRDYGLESSNPTLEYADEILSDMVDNFVEKSFNGAATGYTIGTTRVSDYCNTAIKYINNPYRANIELADIVATLTSAIGDGSTAGAHWTVNDSKMFLLAKIGDHAAGTNSPEAEWPDWWAGTEAASTLTQGIHFSDFTIIDKAEEYANKIVLITDFRRPAYDVWTENGVTNGYWDKSGTTCTDGTSGAGVPDPVVGTYYVIIENALAWTPASEDAAWNVEAWGSPKTIPRLNFYMYKNDLVNNNCQIRMCTTDNSTDYFYCDLATLADPDDEWVFKSIPIGPYWATADEQRKYRWQESGSPLWNDINCLAFYAVDNGVDPGFLLLDDLHFSGKIARTAYNSDEITAHSEIQKVLIARNSMDDSCTADDDTGFAGRICRAELLRRLAEPKTVVFTIPSDVNCANLLMMAGQKTHLHLGKLRGGTTYYIDGVARMPSIQHNWDISGGLATTVTATTDLLNSHPINLPDQYAMWQENMFLNSAEAKNIRAGAEVDLLIPLLEKNYA